MPHPDTDPDILGAYRKQLRSISPPELVLLAWKGQAGIHPDDLIDEYQTVTDNT